MAIGPTERISKLIKDIEKTAKELRADIKKRTQAAPKSISDAADRLRKVAADVAGQVEAYVRGLRLNLEGKSAAKPRAKAARPKAKPRAAKKPSWAAED